MAGFRDALKGELTRQEISLVPRSFDVVGDILIFSDFPKELEKKEKMIAQRIIETMKHIKVVCKKTKIHSGIFRTKKVKILAGVRRKTTIHKENNIRVKLNVETCYFSPRLSNERQRIAGLVKQGEYILVMFSGVGIYPVVLAKNTKAKEIIGVEINPDAYKFAEENIVLNKADNIKLYLGDVRDVVPKLSKKFDRILMPLPKSAEEFLDIALKVSKAGTIVHFYDFLHEAEFDKAIKKIKKHCPKAKKINVIKCGQYSPRKFRICVDFEVR